MLLASRQLLLLGLSCESAGCGRIESHLQVLDRGLQRKVVLADGQQVPPDAACASAYGRGQIRARVLIGVGLQ